MKKTIVLITMIAVVCIVGRYSWAKSAQGTVSMDFDLSDHCTNEVVKLWIPYPISNEDQTITKVQVSGNYKTSAVYTDNKFQTPMLFAKWEKGASSRILHFSFHVVRKEVIKNNFPSNEAAWSPADYAEYLAPSTWGHCNDDVKKLAEKITNGKKSVLAKAKTIYDWTCENTYRDPKTRGCGSGNVCELLKDPGGKCVDISSVFVALARAAGVPSREVFGIRLGKEPVVDITGWQHCWAEFFLPGYGWVPVDPADVRKMMLKHDLKLGDAKINEYRSYFWGGLDPYRVKLAQGRNLILNPPQKGGQINYLMYPFAQVGDKTLDWLDPDTFKYTIAYKHN